MNGVDSAEKYYEDLPISGYQLWNQELDTGKSAQLQGYGSPVRIRVATAENLRHHLVGEVKIPKSIFVHSGTKLVATKTVTIKLSQGENLWFAENESLDIYATGDTAQEALDNFEMHLVSFFKHYKELDPSAATEGAKRLRLLFTKHFREEL